MAVAPRVRPGGPGPVDSGVFWPKLARLQGAPATFSHFITDKAGMALMVAVAGSAKSATLGLAEADAVRGLRIFPIFRGPQTGMCLLETGMPASLVCCPLCSRPTLQFSPGEAANELKIRVPSPFLAPIEFIFPGTKR